ncbi:MAG: DNA-binding protein [Candidatus Pacebacteria bacterium]|nr:DNA-binding protein [Candidatus Paceibacterota bacterium]
MQRTVNDLVRQDVFTTGEVALLWDIAPRTVTKMTDRTHDSLPSYRIGDGLDRRIPRDTLLVFMKAHGIPLMRLEDPFVSRVLCICTNGSIAEEFSKGSFLVRSAKNLLAAGIELQAFWPALVVLDYDFCPDADAICLQVRAYPTHPVVIGIGMDVNVSHEYPDYFVSKKLIAEGLLQVDVGRLLTKRYEKKGY